MEQEINIMTLNCWGIPIVSKDRRKRIQAIGEYLCGGLHNIVCLQEIWSEDDFFILRDKIKNALPYSHYFYSGVLGSGLCIFSKWTIEDVFFHQWPLNGYIHKIQHGDWFGGKGVGLCRIQCEGYLLNVYSAHGRIEHLTNNFNNKHNSALHINTNNIMRLMYADDAVLVAPGEEYLQDLVNGMIELHAEYDTNDIYMAHRVLQAYSTAEFVKLTSSNADIVILAGDMNTEPGNISYRLICDVANLTDPALSSDSLKCGGSGALATCNTPDNSYSNAKELLVCPEGKRIDHIFYKLSGRVQAEICKFGNPLPPRVPAEQFSYSDHNSVSLCMKISPSNATEADIDSKTDKTKNTLEEAIDICRDAFATMYYNRKSYLVYASSLFLLLISTVGLWEHTHLLDIIRILITAVCFYCLVMGSLWNCIEMNSLKAGVTSLQKLVNSMLKREDCNDINIAHQ